MDAIKEFKRKHKQAHKELRAAAQKYIDNGGLTVVAKEIAPKLDISYQSVINYVYMGGKDGFLTEAITKLFKNN